MKLEQIGITIRDLTAIVVACAAVYRLFLKPYVFTPLLSFYFDIQQGLATIQTMEPHVSSLTSRVTLVVDHMPWATWEAKPDGTNSRVNIAFQRMFGYSAEDMRGFGWKSLLHPDDRDEYMREWESCVKELRPFHHTKSRFITRQGVPVHVHVAATFINGTTSLWMGTVHTAHPQNSGCEICPFISLSPEIKRSSDEKE